VFGGRIAMVRAVIEVVACELSVKSWVTDMVLLVFGRAPTM
jgi:hypothetical protein